MANSSEKTQDLQSKFLLCRADRREARPEMRQRLIELEDRL